MYIEERKKELQHQTFLKYIKIEANLNDKLSRTHDTWTRNLHVKISIWKNIMKYKRRLLLRCIHHFKSDLINNNYGPYAHFG